VTRSLELPVEEKVGPVEGELEENLQKGVVKKAVEERGRWKGGERNLLARKLLAIILQP